MIKQNFRRTAVAAAMLAAFGPVRAQMTVEEFTQLSQPSSSVTAGVGYVSEDDRRFGQFTGFKDRGVEPLLDVEVSNRDNATGTWFKLDGRNLGQDSRELRGEYRVQGDWGAFIDYNQVPRLSPYTFNTSLQGIGSATQTAFPATAVKSDVLLDTERQRTWVWADKKFGNGFSATFSFRNEDKTGARPFGFYSTSTTNQAPVFATEPIQSNTKQWDAVLGYNTENLHLFAAYYGSAYDNANNALKLSGAPSVPSMSLSPSNQSHQLSVYGNYEFSKATKATFKLAYSTATQNESFMTVDSVTTPATARVGPALATLGRNSLDGRVDTTLAQVGFTTRPTRDLSLMANLRYEDRDNKTPTDNYFCGAVAGSTNSTTNFYCNSPLYAGSDVFLNPVFSRTNVNSKLEANYQLATGYRLIAGADLDELKQSVRNYNSVSMRGRVDESTYRLELRRSMTESINGSLALVHSDRTGSNYVLNNGSTVAAGIAPAILNNTTSSVGPINLADRKRDKLRLMTTWLPSPELSLQFLAEAGRDSYSGRDMGARDGKSSRYTLDAGYLLSELLSLEEAWQLTAWVSHGETELNQNAWSGAWTAGVPTATSLAPTTSIIWAALLGTTDDSVGLGLRGKVNDRLDVGADLLYSDEVSKQDQSLVRDVSRTGKAVTGLPMDTLSDYFYKQQRLHLFGTYAMDKNADIRLDLVYDHRRTDDWSWANLTYTDGTTVSQNPDSSVSFVGVSYIYKFQ